MESRRRNGPRRKTGLGISILLTVRNSTLALRGKCGFDRGRGGKKKKNTDER